MPDITNYDFSGMSTVYEVRCQDGRYIEKGAFDHQDGQTVPIVWKHAHGVIQNILGHAVLKTSESPSGMRAYGFFNITPEGQTAKILVHNRDADALSIWADHVDEQITGNVKHVKRGMIREVSLVQAGKNPGAKIDEVIRHSDDEDEMFLQGVIIHNSNEYKIELPTKPTEEPEEEPEEEPIVHAGPTLNDVLDSFTEEETELFNFVVHSAAIGKKPDPSGKTANGGPTLQEVFDSMTEEKKNVLYFVVGNVSQSNPISQGEIMPQVHNIFDQPNSDTLPTGIAGKHLFGKNVYISHGRPELREVLKAAQTGRVNSLREVFDKTGITAEIANSFSHSITNVSYLFPDAQNVSPGGPQWYQRPIEWVEKVLNACQPKPFSRIKSRYADLTPDAARAKGYVTGAQKAEEVIATLYRVTTPQTVYKLQKLDRDDILDITEFDVVVWLKEEMRMMLREELARAILISDGRSAGADKIVETNVRPIYNDDPVYTVDGFWNDVGNLTALASMTTAEVIILIDFIASQQQYYRGAGSPVFYCAPATSTRFLLLRDGNDQRIHKSMADVAEALRVSAVVDVPVMAGLSTAGVVDPPGLPTGTYTFEHLGVIVNLSDYTIGMDKGGQTSFFEDFDIDYNKMTYLYETRLSGALVVPKSAISIDNVTAFV